MAEELEHYGAWESPFSRRVDIALKLKGVEYKYFEEDLDNKSASLLKYNPIHKMVPVLVHNEKPIPESLIILEYIDETWKGQPILPIDPYERAQARFWARFIDEKYIAAAWKACLNKKDQKKAWEETSEFLKVLEKELEHKKFFGGETIGFVDIAASFIAQWVPILDQIVGLETFTQDKFPKLYQWSLDFLTHNVVKEVLPSKDKLVTFYANYISEHAN